MKNKILKNLKIKFGEGNVDKTSQIIFARKNKKFILVQLDNLNNENVEILTNYSKAYAKQLLGVGFTALSIGQRIYMRIAGLAHANSTDEYFGIYPFFNCQEKSLNYHFNLSFIKEQSNTCYGNEMIYYIYEITQ